MENNEAGVRVNQLSPCVQSLQNSTTPKAKKRKLQVNDSEGSELTVKREDDSEDDRKRKRMSPSRQAIKAEQEELLLGNVGNNVMTEEEGIEESVEFEANAMLIEREDEEEGIEECVKTEVGEVPLLERGLEEEGIEESVQFRRDEVLPGREQEVKREEDSKNIKFDREELPSVAKEKGTKDEPGGATFKIEHNESRLDEEEEREEGDSGVGQVSGLEGEEMAIDEREEPASEEPTSNEDDHADPMPSEQLEGESPLGMENETHGSITVAFQDPESCTQEELLFEEENEKKKDEPITMMDLESCRLPRETLVKHSMKPWFEDFVRGAWVRYLVGNDPAINIPQYRICEITRVLPCEKPYKLDNEMTDLQFELKHGKSVKTFRMDLVSNSAFTEKEFERMKKTYLAEKENPPSKFTLDRKKEQLAELATRTWNEADLSKMLARKQELASKTSNQSPTMLALERGRLLQQRTLAGKRGDHAEVTEINIRIQEINSKLNSLQVLRADSEGAERHVFKSRQQDILARVNERNRRANMETVRKNELMEAERKRKERNMGAAPGSLTPVDPSARSETLPRVLNSARTPGVSNPSTLDTPPVSKGGPSSLAKAGSTSPVKKMKALDPESSFLASIEVDLGDF